MDKATRNKAIAGAAVAGVAAVAATAGLMASRRGGAPVVYYVRPTGDGWVVGTEGTAAPVSTHATKRAAVTAARRLAGAHAPSQLAIHRMDGTVQARHSYGVDDPG